MTRAIRKVRALWRVPLVDDHGNRLIGWLALAVLIVMTHQFMERHARAQRALHHVVEVEASK